MVTLQHKCVTKCTGTLTLEIFGLGWALIQSPTISLCCKVTTYWQSPCTSPCAIKSLHTTDFSEFLPRVSAETISESWRKVNLKKQKFLIFFSKKTDFFHPGWVLRRCSGHGGRWRRISGRRFQSSSAEVFLRCARRRAVTQLGGRDRPRIYLPRISALVWLWHVSK